MSTAAPPPEWLADLQARLGPQGLWAGPQAQGPDALPLLRDWRGRYEGRALAIARPSTVDEVAAVVQACARHGVPIVPQGGNTGLVGGSIPDSSGQAMLLSLVRLNRVRAVDPGNLSLTVDAGCTLAAVQASAAAHGLLFPLSLASEGSCTIGGNLATNAGGTQVLRYGTARELCLGLEVVTATGEVWNGLSALRKDNTGYDLRDLFVGSEGTLGVITGAVLRLHPAPRGRATALVGCADLAAAAALLDRARRELDADLTAFEAMERTPLQLVQRHLPDQAACLAGGLSDDGRADAGQPPPWTVLVEVISAVSSEHAQDRLGQWLALAAGPAVPALMATSLTQHRQLWALREAIPLAEKTEGVMVKHDIGLPASAIPTFAARTEALLHGRWPGCRIVCFGHLGDGNLHYNVQPPPGLAGPEAFAGFEREVNALVFDEVAAHGGTLSAEHGIGRLRRDELARRKDPVALALMRSVKQALDPQGLFNPGRML